MSNLVFTTQVPSKHEQSISWLNLHQSFDVKAGSVLFQFVSIAFFFGVARSECFIGVSQKLSFEVFQLSQLRSQWNQAALVSLGGSSKTFTCWGALSKVVVL